MSRRRRRQDSGYALLLVLLISAIIAIQLYRELPRIAFQNERQKEQLLIERGEQYKRAIQLFLRANKNTRWPASLDELESFNNMRFLRHRYKDPVTGKDEWRLIHIANGVLQDSVNNKPKKPGGADQGKSDISSSNISQYAGLGQDLNAGTASLNPANRRRASEGGTAPQIGPDGMPLPGSGTNNNGQPPAGMPGLPGMPGMPNANPQGANGAPSLPTSPNLGANGQPNGGLAVPPGPGQPGFGQPNFGQPNNNQSNSNQNSFGGSSVGNYGSFGSTPTPTPGQGNVPAMPGGFPGMPGPTANSQNLGGTPAYPNMAGANGSPPGYPQPGMSINPQQNSAASALIGSLLTSPRPGGIPTAATAGGNAILGTGIAGVASSAEGETIMVYGDHTDIGQWEFLWDPTKWRPPPNPLQGTIGTPAASLGSMPTGQVGTSAASLGTPAGAMNGPGGTANPSTSPMATGGVAPGGAGAPGMGAGMGGAGFGSGTGAPDIRPGRQ